MNLLGGRTITTGDNRLLHATVAVDNITIAEDLDCPALAEGEFAPFSLVRLTEFTGNTREQGETQRDVADVCKFERNVNDADNGASDDDADADATPSDLGRSALSVTGVHWAGRWSTHSLVYSLDLRRVIN